MSARRDLRRLLSLLMGLHCLRAGWAEHRYLSLILVWGGTVSSTQLNSVYTCLSVCLPSCRSPCACVCVFLCSSHPVESGRLPVVVVKMVEDHLRKRKREHQGRSSKQRQSSRSGSREKKPEELN